MGKKMGKGLKKKPRADLKREKTRGSRKRPYPLAGLYDLKGREKGTELISSPPSRQVEHGPYGKGTSKAWPLSGDRHTPEKAFELSAV